MKHRVGRSRAVGAMVGGSFSGLVHACPLVALLAGATPESARPCDDVMMVDELEMVMVVLEEAPPPSESEALPAPSSPPAVLASTATVRRPLAPRPAIPVSRSAAIEAPTSRSPEPEPEPEPELDPDPDPDPGPDPADTPEAPPAAAASAPAAPTRPGDTTGEPARRALPTDVARTLRIHDPFPRLPITDLDVVVSVCVSERGAVTDATFASGVHDSSAATLQNAILRWRYRPLRVDGVARPFCHLMRITYGTN